MRLGHLQSTAEPVGIYIKRDLKILDGICELFDRSRTQIEHEGRLGLDEISMAAARYALTASDISSGGTRHAGHEDVFFMNSCRRPLRRSGYGEEYNDSDEEEENEDMEDEDMEAEAEEDEEEDEKAEELIQQEMEEVVVEEIIEEEEDEEGGPCTWEDMWDEPEIGDEGVDEEAERNDSEHEIVADYYYESFRYEEEPSFLGPYLLDAKPWVVFQSQECLDVAMLFRHSPIPATDTQLVAPFDGPPKWFHAVQASYSSDLRADEP